MIAWFIIKGICYFAIIAILLLYHDTYRECAILLLLLFMLLHRYIYFKSMCYFAITPLYLLQEHVLFCYYCYFAITVIHS